MLNPVFSAVYLFRLAGLALLLTFGAAHAQDQDLRVGDETFSSSQVESFGEIGLSRSAVCPPVSDKYLLDSFVQNVLMAQAERKDEGKRYQQHRTDTLEPLYEKLKKSTQFRDKHTGNRDVTQVYTKQLNRIEARIELAKAYLEQALEDRTQFRISSFDRLKRLDGITDGDKQTLANQMGFADRYRERVGASIKEEHLQQRYDTLIKNKDERIVDVNVFEYRSLLLGSNEKSVVETATEYLELDTAERHAVPWVIMTPDTLSGEKRWSQLSWLEEHDQDPDNLQSGSAILVNQGKIRGFEEEVYRLFYIYDKAHYPLIGLHEKTNHRSPAINFIRRDEVEERMTAEHQRLWRQSVVTYQGSVITMATEYAKCPPPE